LPFTINRGSLVAIRNKKAIMFDTIDIEIEKTEGGPRPVRTKLVRFAGVLAILLVFAGALYYAIVTFE
jgi:hypothetical protein